MNKIFILFLIFFSKIFSNKFYIKSDVLSHHQSLFEEKKFDELCIELSKIKNLDKKASEDYRAFLSILFGESSFDPTIDQRSQLFHLFVNLGGNIFNFHDTFFKDIDLTKKIKWLLKSTWSIEHNFLSKASKFINALEESEEKNILLDKLKKAQKELEQINLENQANELLEKKIWNEQDILKARQLSQVLSNQSLSQRLFS